MHFVTFPGANARYVKPESMTDEECSEIAALRMPDRIIVAVVPNKGDLEAIQAGRPIYISVLQTFFCPMGVFTLDENGQLNE